MADQMPMTDQAAPLLSSEPTINDNQRADLWDAFHSKSPEELIQHLQPLAVPDDFKKRFVDAKKKSMPPVDPIDKTASVMNRMASMDPKILDLAERHPNVLRALTTAIAAAEKGSQEAAGANKTAGKGKTSAGSKKPAPLAQPPRADGLEHYAPIPEGHHRVLASDGGIHDIPAENIEQARATDPYMHVLNP